MWDLDDLLQDSGNNLRSQAAAEDNASNEMDVDINPPKSSKGTFLAALGQWVFFFNCFLMEFSTW